MFIWQPLTLSFSASGAVHFTGSFWLSVLDIPSLASPKSDTCKQEEEEEEEKWLVDTILFTFAVPSSDTRTLRAARSLEFMKGVQMLTTYSTDMYHHLTCGQSFWTLNTPSHYRHVWGWTVKRCKWRIGEKEWGTCKEIKGRIFFLKRRVESLNTHLLKLRRLDLAITALPRVRK